MTEQEIFALERPHPSLLKLYLIRSVLSGPAIILALPILFFRYHTLRYRFDDEGIHARRGILFRREVNLADARIQDIHLTSGVIQRWFGLADVQIQTASGSAGPELVVEGFKGYEGIRDFLYTRMRGYRKPGAPAAVPPLPGTAPADPGEIATALRALTDELRATRAALEARSTPRP
jgi:hypothetical protein